MPMLSDNVIPVWELRRDSPLYYRARRQQHREMGVCTNCTRPAVEGKRRCQPCAARITKMQQAPHHKARHKAYMEKRRNERISQGKCARCALPLGQFDPVGIKHCYGCREYQREHAKPYHEIAKQVRMERKAQGLCTKCGVDVSNTGYLRCAKCRAYNRAIVNAAYQRAKRRAARAV